MKYESAIPSPPAPANATAALPIRLRPQTRIRLFSSGSSQQIRHLASRAKQHGLQAANFEAEHLGDIAVRRTLGVSQPEKRPFTSFKPGHGRYKIRTPFGSAGRVCRGNRVDN